MGWIVFVIGAADEGGGLLDVVKNGFETGGFAPVRNGLLAAEVELLERKGFEAAVVGVALDSAGIALREGGIAIVLNWKPGYAGVVVGRPPGLVLSFYAGLVFKTFKLNGLFGVTIFSLLSLE